MRKGDKTLKELLEEAKKREAARKEEIKSIQAPESTFRLQAPTNFSETPKEKGKVRSFIEERILPTIRGTAEEVGSMVLARDIAVSEAPAMFKEGLKYNAKQEIRSGLEQLVNERVLGALNRRLPFDLSYSSQEPSNAGPKNADMTVTVKEEEWEKRAKKLKMIK